MSLPVLQWGFLALALLLANLPWLSQRCFLILQCDSKSMWVRLLEWFVLYFVVGGIALLLEDRTMGSIYPQAWEFYAVTLALFMVFAFPGFIYRHVR
ncbi:DUF2818 family protein [Thiothrix litoralis]|jgi:lysylphosphatidylglycerol synthetase-like protein (DUF2156 family)|uniref:DUF2818 family protein n=1 Tax=Thiothrix litoralis TaxID=2891210 RepID=A0ABX7WMQ7_9GAMM|nr:DUF2818 family protein [Thiothrix litoralis]QTR44600.1 DUF2818 family protein [Thiothrix litoralis]